MRWPDLRTAGPYLTQGIACIIGLALMHHDADVRIEQVRKQTERLCGEAQKRASDDAQYNAVLAQSMVDVMPTPGSRAHGFARMRENYLLRAKQSDELFRSACDSSPTDRASTEPGSGKK